MPTAKKKENHRKELPNILYNLNQKLVVELPEKAGTNTPIRRIKYTNLFFLLVK